MVVIITIVTYFLRWTLLKFFSSFPDEQGQQKVRQLDRITCAVINTSNEVKSPLLWEFWIYIFLWEFKKGSLVGSIVNIRNESLFFRVHGEWIVARNKQIGREPLRGSRDLFVPPNDSFPMNPEKRHSFLNYFTVSCNCNMYSTQKKYFKWNICVTRKEQNPITFMFN